MIEDPKRRRRLLVAAIAIVGLLIVVIEISGNKSHVPGDAANLPASERGLTSAADFSGGTTNGWLNTPDNASLDLVALRGQVVLVDFWTYSCINCLHTLPHVTLLYDTYRSHGLVVVGVHSPEFGFEKVRSNVQKAIAQNAIHYPVVQDNDYGIWNAYSNNYWPADYLIDQYGKIRHTHFGEGDYTDIETQVRGLLREAGFNDLPAPVENNGPAATGTHTPELYAAAGRSAIGNPEGYQAGKTVAYTFPASRDPDAIYLDGTWQDGDDGVTAVGDARIYLDFTAAASNIVASGPDGACVEVTLDGKPMPANLAGPDVHAGTDRSCLTLSGARSYDLFAGPHGSHAMQLKVPAGFELFTFDFT